MPRYVVLEHDHPVLHWDWMLESGPVLRTWRLEQPPSSGTFIRATALPDHRLAYLDYEGPVSGGRGTVTRWDAGTYNWSEDGPGRLVLMVNGGRLCGEVELRKLKPDDWHFVFRRQA